MSEVPSILAEARNLAANVEDDGARSLLMGWIAGGLARVGELDAALEVAASMQTPEDIDLAYLQIARGCTEVGNLEAAREALSRITTEWARIQAMTHLVRRFAEAHRNSGALKLAAAIPTAGARAHALSSIAFSSAVSGEVPIADSLFEEAIGITTEAENLPAYERVGILLEIAQAQARAGYRSAAVRTVDRAMRHSSEIENGPARDLYEAQASAVLARAGLLGEATYRAYRLESLRYRAIALRAVAEGYTEMGDMISALKIAQTIPDVGDESDERARAFQTLAIANSNDGNFPAALEIVQLMPADHWIRADTLATIGYQQAYRGESESAAVNFEEAFDLAERVQDDFLRAQAVRLVAVRLAEAGDYAGALRLAATISLTEESNHAYSGVAYRQANRGDWQAALDWVGDLEPGYLRATTTQGIAMGILDCAQREKILANRE